MVGSSRWGMMAALILTSSCQDGAPGGDAASGMPERQQGAQQKVLRSETVPAIFTGWDQGDYVWARVKVEGREPIGAWSGPSPIDLFLDAHVGKPIIVTIDTIMADVPEAGGAIEVQRISAARIGDLSAEAWWSSLSQKQRQDAQISLAGSLEPRPPSLEQGR